MSSPAHPSKAMADKRLKKRYRSELRFRAYGIAAIVFAISSLAILLVSIVGNSLTAFQKHELAIDVMLAPQEIDPSGQRDPADLRANVSAFSEVVRHAVRERFPDVAEDRDLRRQLARMVSTLSGEDLAEDVARNPALVGTRVKAHVPVSDLTDLYLKGLISPQKVEAGAVAAQVARNGTAVSVSAPGGFAAVYEDMRGRLQAQAETHERAAQAAADSAGRMRARIAAIEARKAGMASQDAAGIAADAEAYVIDGDERQTALARAAGQARASGQADALRTLLVSEYERAATAAQKEAGELLKRGESYARKGAEAERSGQPTAETRRIQSAAAFLAADRKRVDAKLLADETKALASASPEQLQAAASVKLGRALAPLGEVAAADATTRKIAVMAANAGELSAAEALVAEQETRIAALEAEAAALMQASPVRAQAMQETAIPGAKARLTRLVRERDARREARDRLTGVSAVPVPDPAAPVVPATPDPAAAPQAPAVDEATFVTEEAQAQLGVDLGGPVAMAYALGLADGGDARAQAGVRALVAGHVDAELSTAQRDAERLDRRQERELAAAGGLRSQIATPGAALRADEFAPSLLVEINGGVVKAASVTPDAAEGAELIPLKTAGEAAAGAWTMREIEVAEADRLVSDRQAAWANALAADGLIRKVWNFDLLTKADSTYPELAGLAAALAGSFWIMLVTLVLSLPVGVMAAIYLEEFAPRNRVTDFIEVNINNLAAVPSIVFGLLGAAVFINFFDLPRSAPLVGGLVLSLITLPTIIIATRASLGAVPPSIREGALAVGASLPQTVFQHVLPLAAPGIMTGAIIGLARALGETAPLLLIGMVAFVADPPDGMFDSATALPVLVYKWSSAAERAWQPMTSAAIVVLLVFMFAMNAFAVYLRRRLERRW